MPAPKLTPELKLQILSLYCETDASTNELASQFAVSSSTVLRLLKESLSTEDYQKSVKQKQSKHKRSLNHDSLGQDSFGQAPVEQIQSEFLAETADLVPESFQSNYPEKSLKSKIKQKAKVLPSKLKEGKKEQPIVAQSNQLELDQLDLMAPFVAANSANEHQDQIFNAFSSAPTNASDQNFSKDLLENISEQPSQVLPEGIRISAIAPPTNSARLLPKKVIKSVPSTKELSSAIPNQSPSEILSQTSSPSPIQSLSRSLSQPLSQSASQKFDEEEAILDEVTDQFDPQDDEFDRLDDVLDDEDDSDDEGEEEDSQFNDTSLNGIDNPDGESQTEVQIYSLEDADLPSTCYMVVDKSSEMITRPLRDFSEIGKIPVDEQTRATLMIFPNHRVAKRFSRQNQRVIKFSAELLYITQQKLAAKGITRLLFEGRVYAL
jgi:transposase-like protein